MPSIPEVIEAITTLLTLAGIVYMLLALWGARDFHRTLSLPAATFAPPVSILKPLKGTDDHLDAGLESHCLQQYPGPYELIFGVHTPDDPAIAAVDRLRLRHPNIPIHLILCPQRLGTSGKVSNLVQMLPHATHSHLLINDADILVSPHYLTGVMAPFANPHTGLVTAPYIGTTSTPTTLWAKIEALGISTDFMPGVLTARKLEGGIRFGLGSTLAMSKAALSAAGGLQPLSEYLADDYELGNRIAAAGFHVALCGQIVATTVPSYNLAGFWHHQLRWARSTRDSRKLGYVGLGITYCVPWALATVIASGASLWSLSLLTFALLARLAVALTVGVGVLRDPHVLRDLWLLPLRDCCGLLFWLWSFAGDTVLWRGERFRLHQGRITQVS